MNIFLLLLSLAFPALGQQYPFAGGGNAAGGGSISPDLINVSTLNVTGQSNFAAPVEIQGQVAPTAFRFQVSSGTTGVLRVNGNGNVGLGTTNPQSMLDVYTDASATVGFTLRNTANSNRVTHQLNSNANEGKLTLNNSAGTAAVEFVGGTSANSFINGGNVGIGTTSPGRLLDVNGAAVVRGVFDVRAASTTLYSSAGDTNPFSIKGAAAGGNILRMYDDGTGGGLLEVGDQNGVGTIRLWNNGASWINTGQNVGIGTTSPQTLLDVNGASQFGSGATKSTFSATGDLTLTGKMAIGMAVDSARSINVTNTPGSGSPFGAVFVMNGAATTNTGVYVDAANGTTNHAFRAANGDIIVDTGRIGVGTTSPATLIHGSSGTLTLDGTGAAFTIGTSASTSTLTGAFVLATTQTPASGEACTAGKVAWDASYIYICTASGAWKRAALTGGY